MVSEYIKSEVESGRPVRLVPEDLVPLFKISLTCLIPKSHQFGKWRLIVDLSYPKDHSVNAGISEELASNTYAIVDDALECIKALGVAPCSSKWFWKVHTGIYQSTLEITICWVFHGRGGPTSTGLSGKHICFHSDNMGGGCVAAEIS